MLLQNKTKTLQVNYRLIFLKNKKAEILYKMLYWETKFRGTYQDYTAWPHMGCILEYNLVQYVRNENTVVQSLSLVWLFQPHGPQHIRFPCPSLSPESSLKLMSMEWWCRPTISSSAAPFFSCPPSFPASESFPVNQIITSSGQSTGASASASVLPMNIQGCY